MKTEILSLEGIDAARLGWRLSRDRAREVPAEEVMLVDVPVCELPTCHLEIEATILEREIFASPRNHVMWARTSHVDDPAEFRISEGLRRPSNEANRRRMIADRAAGKSQDEWRFHLPVTSLTSWSCRISYRDLVKLAGYFQRLSAREEISGEVRRMLALAGAGLSEVVTEFTGSTRLTAEAILTMQRVDFLHEGPVRVGAFSRETDNFYVIAMAVPLWLRAQVVRHRPLSFVDTFYRDVLACPDALDATIGRPVSMELAATKEYWRSVLSKRSCWLAQDQLSNRRDLWQEIIDRFGSPAELLPCRGGICPYSGDAALRFTDADPGVPCPVYCDLNEVDKAPHRQAMIAAAASRHPWWLERIG